MTFLNKTINQNPYTLKKKMSNCIQISRKTHNYTNFMSVNQKITGKFIFYKQLSLQLLIEYLMYFYK